MPEIARILFISQPFATKIIHRLKKENIVGTYQGRSGGIFLKRDPGSISFWDILQAMGFNGTVNECVQNPRICPLVTRCKIHLFMEAQERTFFQNLKDASIADFAYTENELMPQVQKPVLEDNVKNKEQVAG